MVSISFSDRFHDMMAIVQGRAGLSHCDDAKVRLVGDSNAGELSEGIPPRYDAKWTLDRGMQ